MRTEEQQNEVWRMSIDLNRATLPKPVWPERVRVRTFSLSDASSLHSLLVHGYEHGGGSVASFETWLRQTTDDEEFDPELVFLAESREALVGAALCWTSSFVKDVVVRESWRRRGLGEALLRHAFRSLAMRGASAVELKVQAPNTGAVRLYERLGMRVVERLVPD
jgi:ribosomal protein S18 acetylase RimI-like enzyme